MAADSHLTLLDEFVKDNRNVFSYMLQLYYPLTDAMLTKHFGKSSQGQIVWSHICANESMDWTKEFIDKYKKKDYISWTELSANPKVSAGREKEMIELYKDSWRWMDLSTNKGIKFDMEIIDKYANKLKFVELSQNPSVQFTEELLIKYGKNWAWKHIRLNPGVKWTRDMIDRVREGTGNEDIIHIYLTAAPGMDWSPKNIDEVKDIEQPITWDNLSANDGLPWSMDLFKRYEKYWYIKRLCKLRKFPWTAEFIDKYADKWDWPEMSGNPALPFTEALIKKYENKWVWSSGSAQWTGMSGNPSLPWSSEKFIDDYLSKWNSRTITQNPGLPWSLDFIKRYRAKLRFSMSDMYTNKAIWDKAFKPIVTDEVIDNLFPKYYY